MDSQTSDAVVTHTSGFFRKLQACRRIRSEDGLLALWRAGVTVFAKWWRQGEIWELRKSGHVRLGGCRFVLDRRIGPALRELLTTGIFEIHERKALRRYVDGSLPVVELGACIGVVACITNRRLRRPAGHVVVEANPSLVNLIEENRQLNSGAFSVINAAVGYGTGPVPFRVSEENPLESGAYCKVGTAIDLPAITLREILTRYDFQRCILISDIEGSEFDLVAHEAEILGDRVEIIIMELHERLLGEARTAAILGNLRQARFHLLERMHETFIFRNSRFV